MERPQVIKMTGHKGNSRNKGKEDKGKNRANRPNNAPCDFDYALLRKPIDTTITGFRQARKVFDFATEELRGLLSSECDLLYECKVCRNMFRSLANFISHKRVYCKEQFNSSVHGHFFNPASFESELEKIQQLENDYQESLKELLEIGKSEVKEESERVPLTKDLTAVIEKLTYNKGVTENRNESPQVILQDIPTSSVAVFQNINHGETENFDSMQTQINELNNLLSQDQAVLQSDGTFKMCPTNFDASKCDNIIQISDDEENGEIDHDNPHNLNCNLCNIMFSTQKTLKFHMKSQHHESRLVYPCPDCFEIFSTSWSVYRHLFKVHRKTAAQIRRLREAIQTKAFRMNNPPAIYEKKRNSLKPATTIKLSEEERLEQENQAWMCSMEEDGELPRCGGCGRTFERRAALAAHTHTCQPRSRALARRTQDKKIEIQSRKDYIRTSTIVSIEQASTSYAKGNKATTSNAGKSKVKSKIPETITKPPTDEVLKPDITQEDTLMIDIESAIKSSHFNQEAQQTNLACFKCKVQDDIDVETIVCKKCEIKFNTEQELYDHMASHYRWVRYACKLCNYKNYDFEKLPEHVKLVHKLEGDIDFYCSTIKVVDGNEALEILDMSHELNELNASCESRRISRCSSNSSRLSDDSTSSTKRLEGSKKRKRAISKQIIKERNEPEPNLNTIDAKAEDEEPCIPIMSMDKEINIVLAESETSVKPSEESTSDIEESEPKIMKRNKNDHVSTVASRRPIRKKTKPKNEDFEYDLSNLLKMEAQGYRDSQSLLNVKYNPNKKKFQQDSPNQADTNHKEKLGALAILSKKAADNSIAHINLLNNDVINLYKERNPNVFVLPTKPTKSKSSPKKDIVDDSKDTSSIEIETECTIDNSKVDTIESVTTVIEIEDNDSQVAGPSQSNETSEQNTENNLPETSKVSVNIPMIPIALGRQNIDVIKNPLINKNITEFKKVGMKTKILVIKPISRNKDGKHTLNAPLKFQTIKLKDPSKNPTLSTDNKDQVVVVQVPKVPNERTIGLPIPNIGTVKTTNVIMPLTNSSQCNLGENNENIEENRPEKTEEDSTMHVIEYQNNVEQAEFNNEDENTQ